MDKQPINETEVLGQLLFLQSTLDIMPDKQGIIALVCDGLLHVPSVSLVSFLDQADFNDKATLNIPICSRQIKYGCFVIESDNLDLLSKYKPYIQNVANTVALVLDNRRYINEINQNKEKLLYRVDQRTQELAESEQRFLDIMYSSDDIIVLLNEAGVFSDCNEATVQQLGYLSRQEIIGLTPEHISPYLQEDGTRSSIKLHTMIDRALERGFYRFEWNFKRQNNDVFTAEVALSPTVHKGKTAVYCSWRDISKQKQLEADRDAAEKKLQLSSRVFHNTHEGIMITDAKHKIVDVNPAFSEITGYNHSEVIGKNIDMLSSNLQDPEFFKDIEQSVKTHGYWQGEVWNRKKDGEIFAELLTISTLLDQDQQIINYVSVFADITESKQQQEKLQLLAHYDVLTQLPNRTLFIDRFEQAIAYSKRSQTLLAVCFLDLDNFKPVNDNYGHETGDKLLIEIANRISSCIRDIDTVSRQGGDEFAILLGDIHNQAQCEETVQRLLAALEKPIVIDDLPHTISASIGVTIYPLDQGELDLLLRHADHAMYQAKQSGRNCYALFNAEHDKQAIQKHHRLNEIEQALINHELQLYYQPKVNMQTGKVFGMEALLRWIHPEKGLIPPLAFLPIISDTALEIKVGNWVINQALMQLEAWQQQDITIEVSVNISSHHLLSQDFFTELEKALAQVPSVNSNYLELEILESSALGDLNEVCSIIKICQEALGVNVALDDFGTGYSSLTHLRHLSANTIKIDQSFTKKMLDDPSDFSIIKGVISLAQAFNRKIIAEGVETTEQGLMLLHMDCQQAQGYSIAKPMPAKEVPEWLMSDYVNATWTEYGNKKYSDKEKKIQLFRLVSEQWKNCFVKNIQASPENAKDWPISNHKKCSCGLWIKHTKQEALFAEEKMDWLEQQHTALHTIADNLFIQYQTQQCEEQADLTEFLEAFDNMALFWEDDNIA